MFTRRQFLGLTAVGGLGLTGCLGPIDPDRPVDPDGPAGPRPPRTEQCASADYMTRFGTVGGVPLAYEENGREQEFLFDADFHTQLDAWYTDWQARTGTSATVIRTYGAWTDGGADCGTSWHHAGRAFDVAGINSDTDVIVSAREDIWRGWSAGAMAAARRNYWALAASLHLHFAYVLSYLYDSAHANHLHVDNGESGAGMSSFRTGSRVQNQAIQAICRHLWDEPCEITGRWDRQTQRATRAVLERLDASGPLTRGDNWAVFLAGSSTLG